MAFLEIACFNAESALIAAESGASRIELCKDGHLGGTTPLLSTFQSLKSQVSIPINVMIRPRGGNFSCADQELVQMEKDILIFKDAGADGFVFGILNDQNLVDEKKCGDLVSAAGDRPCTFHRAFDDIPPGHMEAQLDLLVRCGFKAVLTSGGEDNAVAGKARLKMLVDAAKGRIDIIVGGGVRSSNVEMLRKETAAEVFHSSAIVNADGREVASGREVCLLKELVGC